MKLSTKTHGLPVSMLLAGALALTACGAANEQGVGAPSDGGTAEPGLAGTLVGAGASSQQAAMQGWTAGFATEYPDVTVNYDPVGSGGGREQFLAGGTAFAGTDAYLDEEELAQAEERCPGGEIFELPNYINPIAVPFNLEGVDSLNLPPDVLAGIFAGEITTWNAPEIAEANPDVELPDTPITPVHRSDESGTTENFVEYLAAVAGDVWTYEVSGDWPGELGGEAGQGTSGVIQAVQAGQGTIGYADLSQVGDLPVAAVGVGEDFVEPTPEAAAAVVENSEVVEGRPEHSYAIDLARDTTESGNYPIVLVSYHVGCLTYEDQETADLVSTFMSYVVSQEGQQAAAEAAGSAPISDGLRAQAEEAIDAISAQ